MKNLFLKARIMLVSYRLKNQRLLSSQVKNCLLRELGQIELDCAYRRAAARKAWQKELERSQAKIERLEIEQKELRNA